MSTVWRYVPYMTHVNCNRGDTVNSNQFITYTKHVNCIETTHVSCIDLRNRGDMCQMYRGA